MITDKTDNKENRKFTSFCCANGKTIDVCRLGMADFASVLAFYECELAKLENPADFYPYKNSEIESILSGGGIFIGGYEKGKLCALCAIDFDKGYQEGVKKANADFPSFPFESDLLEFSGLFVAREFRNLGIAVKMTAILLDIAKVEVVDSRLFAVVLESNIASMKNFFAHGFKLFGWWKMDEEFKFVYLISPQNQAATIIEKPLEKIPLANLLEKLEKGYVFSDVTKECEFLGC